MIYLFDSQERLFKIISKRAVKSAVQTYSLNKERYVSDRLTVETKLMSDEEFEKADYMAIQSIDNSHQYHYFYIAQKSFDDKTNSFIGVQSGIEELQKSVVYDKRPHDAFARDVINDLLDGTNWIARFVGDSIPKSTNFYYTSVFEALKKVCEVWELEMQFFVEMNGNKIGARYIEFKKKIGAVSGKRVVYGHNALEIVKEVERTNIYTALIGRGKGEQVSSAGDQDNSGSAQLSDGYGRKITFEDVVWSKANGLPVDKPKGQKYVELPHLTAQYGIKNSDGSMRPKIGFIEFSEEENHAELLRRTFFALVDTGRPQVEFKTSAVYLKGVSIGDTVRVVRHDKHIDYDTRVFEISVNRLNNRSTSIKLGDQLTQGQNNRIQSAVDKAVDNFVSTDFSNFVQRLPDFLPSANGFNRNWYSTEDPVQKNKGKVLIGDVWYKPDPEHEGHKIMLQWTGEAWEEILRTYDTEKVKREVTAEFNKLSEESKKMVDDYLKNIDLSNLGIQEIGQVVERLSKIERTNEVTAEMIGYDGLTRYNKNRVDGQTTRRQKYGTENIILSLNGDGFENGKTYTVSFNAECIPLLKKILTFIADKTMPLKLKITPVYGVKTAQEADIPKGAKKTTRELSATLYDVLVASDWYKTQTVRVDASETDTVNLELEYREIADGNEDGDYWVGYWDENPEFILFGGGNE